MIVTLEMVIGAIAFVAIAGFVLWLGVMTVLHGPGEESPSGLAAAKLGLAWKRDLVRGGAFEGRIGNMIVRLSGGTRRRRPRVHGDSGLRFEILLNRPSELSFCSRALTRSLLSFSPDDPVTGDAGFDKAVSLSGTHDAVARASADATLLAEIRAAVESYYARFDGTRLEAVLRSPSDVEDGSRVLVRLAERLAPRTTPDDRVARSRP